MMTPFASLSSIRHPAWRFSDGRMDLVVSPFALMFPLSRGHSWMQTVPTDASSYHSPEQFPGSWVPNDGCPSTRRGSDPAAVPKDAPIRSTYGPRPLLSDGERYDFHRGLDLAAPGGDTCVCYSRWRCTGRRGEVGVR